MIPAPARTTPEELARWDAVSTRDVLGRVRDVIAAYRRQAALVRAGNVIARGKQPPLTIEWIDRECERLEGYAQRVRYDYAGRRGVAALDALEPAAVEVDQVVHARPRRPEVVYPRRVRTGPYPVKSDTLAGGASHEECGGAGCVECSGTGMRTVGAQYLENVFGEVAAVEPARKLDQVARKPAPPMEATVRGPAVQASFGW